MLRTAGWVALVAVIVLADWTTKRWALGLDAPIEVAPFLRIVLVLNTGAAFGILGDGGAWVRLLLVALPAIVAVVLLGAVWVQCRRPNHAAESLPYSLIAAGALGNLHDRAARGAVVDFVDLHAGGWHWPAFNVADASICLGVAVLAIVWIRASRTGI